MIRVFLILFMSFFVLTEVFSGEKIVLPKPSYQGGVSLEEAIFKRKSVRRYREEDLSLEELSQLLWASWGEDIDGITSATRVYPSAGAIYPESFYIVVNRVKGLEKGLYKYDSGKHSLELIKKGDFSFSLAKACLSQPMPQKASVNFIFAARPQEIYSRYGERGESLYLPLEIGASCQNLHLQAQVLGLGTVMISAFSEEEVRKILGIREKVYCIMPVGRK